MKQKIYLLLLWLCCLNSYAQPPQGIGYQSIARNVSGAVLTGTTIAVKISILNADTSVAYRETHHPMTNANGYYSLTIGSITPPDVGVFASIDWKANNKLLKVEIDPANGTTFPAGLTSTTPFMSVPYAFFAKTALNITAFTIRDNMAALKTNAGTKNNELCYIRGYTWFGDGGEGLFIWKTDPVFKTNNGVGVASGYYHQGNDGTIVQAATNGVPNDTGRWVRLYDDYISVAYFGANGYWGNQTATIQAAIDFAKLVANGSSDYQSHFASTTVFIPSGIYPIDKITLKDGVDIVGESIDRTMIMALPDGTAPCLIDMEAGMVHTNVSNLHLYGKYPGTNGSNKTAMFFKGQVGPYGAGGLTNSTFRNIIVEFFKGHGIHMSAGTTGSLPNDTTIFENVRIFRFYGVTPAIHSLYIDNDNRLYSFINCQFDGGGGGESFYMASTGSNVYIDGNGSSDYALPHSINFLNTTIQNGDYGVYINGADNVNFDTCWFENLGTGVYADGTLRPCKGINITNSRFANVAGYGAFSQYLDANYMISTGYCIESKNSVVNATNNLMVGGDPCTNCGFSKAHPGNLGLNLSMNSFTQDNLAKMTGVMQTATQSGSTLDCKQNNEISATGSGTITTISSTINTGEVVLIKAASSLTFSRAPGSNITFPGSSTTLTLTTGEMAEFMKTDFGGLEKFQLVRIKR
ncbi:hypothetical protein FLLO111716_09010 [Flavobacterium longum]|uniref:hypothetical protein n=1 Tax=Flavobacterium longum TaxID=1299340 RepID=UPI0039E8FC2D